MENKSIYILKTSLIRSYRRKHKISQKEFGTQLGGLKQQTIARWERGLSFPDQKNLSLIAARLGVDIKDLYLIDPKVIVSVPGDSEDLVLVLLSFRKRIREIIDEVGLTDLEMMRILINECEILINNRYKTIAE